ncbi:MAG TPA: hypothetical protein VK989_05415 [Polyangia bacterium]|jgi:hypothetical protein|nr:hypothetical protein [Polyangia bacterium]
MRFVLLALVVLGAGGCAKHGVDAVKAMRARACAGDAAGFFDHVDRQEMIRLIRAQAEQKAEVAFADLDPVARAAKRENFRAHVDSSITTSVNDTFTVWAYDIKQGSTSDLCGMSIMESSEVDGAVDVHVRSLAAGDRHWRMTRHEDRWLLAGVGP